MAADVITRFKLETTQFDSKLRDAAKGLSEYSKQAELAGKEFDKFTKRGVEAAKAFGAIESGAKNTKDRLKDLVGAYNDVARAYNNLTEQQRQSDFGKAMAQSLSQLQDRIKETKEELLQLGIVEMRERYKSKSREIIVPFELEMELNGVSFIVPQRGEKKHLLELSIMNVKQYKVDRLKQADKLNPEQKKTRILKEIQEQLHLPKIPAHIECFDNSNIQGSDAVAACVVFKMGKPSKKEYRKFNIKTVEGPDDYASMREVVGRRYTRLLEEGSPLPDLIITDGGKGQMEVVREVIEDELKLNIPIAGLAKDNKHRTSELLYGFPPMIIGVKQNTPLFHLLENIQDEVHRFAITFHRDKRSKSQIASVLDNIPGIGEKRKTALLKAFKSVSRIKKASLEELAEIVGPSIAKNIQEKLKE